MHVGPQSSYQETFDLTRATFNRLKQSIHHMASWLVNPGLNYRRAWIDQYHVMTLISCIRPFSCPYTGQPQSSFKLDATSISIHFLKTSSRDPTTMPRSRTSPRSVAGSSNATPGAGSFSGIASLSSKEGPRPRPRFPRSALRKLEEWVSAHRQSPYPTDKDLDHLTVETGLKRSQISTWFANVRKRGKVPKSETHSNPSAMLDMPLVPSPPMEEVPLFHRWLNSWTEQEAAALPAILDAVVQLNGVSCANFLQGSTRYHREFCSSESSLSSMEVRSYAANVESVHPDEWKADDDIAAMSARSSRRRRQLPVRSDTCSYSEKLANSDVSRKFQCTFCADRFRTKYDWQRHEKTIHLPHESWTCSPNGGVDVNPSTNEITCVFCGVLDPTPSHISGHGYTTCANRSVTERTFYRKDHLRQHLRLMHGSCTFVDSIESWKSIRTSIHSRCGFCDALLSSWTGRVEHLAEHFIDGYSVAEDWTGDWGFDEEIVSVLERASLPGNNQITDVIEAPSSMMEDTCGNSIGSLSFPCDTELFTDYPDLGFGACDMPNAWDGSLDLETDCFDLDFSQEVKSNDSAATDLPFVLPLDGHAELEAYDGSDNFDVAMNYYDFKFYDNLPPEAIPVSPSLDIHF
ncbi:hypothetical protein ONS96_000610 [Cadophora gregata f. sp. sojae]|nr:hypothetical protein ONS96_000610 [Cadophora gregata f. sp. sojae]